MFLDDLIIEISRRFVCTGDGILQLINSFQVISMLTPAVAITTNDVRTYFFDSPIQLSNPFSSSMNIICSSQFVDLIPEVRRQSDGSTRMTIVLSRHSITLGDNG